MFRKKLSLQVEPIEKDVFSPNKEEDKKEFKSHIQKPKRNDGEKRKLKSPVLNSLSIL